MNDETADSSAKIENKSYIDIELNKPSEEAEKMNSPLRKFKISKVYSSAKNIENPITKESALINK